jgi:hypothetical protein
MGEISMSPIPIIVEEHHHYDIGPIGDTTPYPGAIRDLAIGGGVCFGLYELFGPFLGSIPLYIVGPASAAIVSFFFTRDCSGLFEKALKTVYAGLVGWLGGIAATFIYGVVSKDYSFFQLVVFEEPIEWLKGLSPLTTSSIK